jgi:hypothetical protein
MSAGLRCFIFRVSRANVGVRSHMAHSGFACDLAEQGKGGTTHFIFLCFTGYARPTGRHTKLALKLESEFVGKPRKDTRTPGDLGTPPDRAIQPLLFHLNKIEP